MHTRAHTHTRAHARAYTDQDGNPDGEEADWIAQEYARRLEAAKGELTPRYKHKDGGARTHVRANEPVHAHTHTHEVHVRTRTLHLHAPVRIYT